jgi:hypothetical protein
MEQMICRLEKIERFIATRSGPLIERAIAGDYLERLDRLEVEARDRMRRFDEGRYLDRIERLEQHLDRQSDLIAGLLDVLVVTHPDSVVLFETLHQSAKATLRIIRGGGH